MAKLDISAMTAADRAALATQLASFQEREAKLTELVAAFKSGLSSAGFTVADAVPMLNARGAASRLGKPASKSSADSTGAVPSPGVTYVHPETGVEWTKAASGKGAPRKEFVALVAKGKVTWEQLAKGGGRGAKKRSAVKKKEA